MNGSGPRPATVPGDRAAVERLLPGGIATRVVEADPDRAARRVDGRGGPELVGSHAPRGGCNRSRFRAQRFQLVVERLYEDTLITTDARQRVRDVDASCARSARPVDGHDRVRVDADAKR